MKLGTMEIVLLIVLALLLFGGTKVAGLGKALGTSIREFKGELGKDKAGKETPDDTDVKSRETDEGN